MLVKLWNLVFSVIFLPSLDNGKIHMGTNAFDPILRMGFALHNTTLCWFAPVLDYTFTKFSLFG